MEKIVIPSSVRGPGEWGGKTSIVVGVCILENGIMSTGKLLHEV